jgi:DNA repair protein RadD
MEELMNNQDIATFFADTRVSIFGNSALRDPQREGYESIHRHFAESSDACYVQLPVGCGKTGLMGLTPFGLATGRVLIIAPNLTIRTNIIRELDVSNANCFYTKRGVFVPTNGPFISELKTGAHLHDCDSAHIVVGNIQQFAGANNRWYEKFPDDYFQLILVDEGHHNVAETWQRLFAYFAGAKIVSFTATPMRSDGQVAIGTRVYAFGYARSMMMGYISPIDAIYVKPETVTFTARGETRTLALKEVLEMRESDWFSKGIALSEHCNRHIVQASVRQLEEVRRFGTPRQIIAVTCTIRHAEQVVALYRELGLRAEVLHSDLKTERREEIEAALRSGLVDVVVQVNILGEGYDLGTLSVAAVFRPYRSLAPYIQFLGRILRLAIPTVPDSPGNRVYIVSHAGLNDERWWEDFTQFDKDDQQFFAELTVDETDVASSGAGPRMTLRPFMRVLNETLLGYVQKGFLRQIDETMVTECLDTIRSKGFDPSEFGITEEMMKRRLELAARGEREIAAEPRIVQPQRQREALKPRVYQEARSIADTVINRLNLRHQGGDLIRYFPGKGPSNSSILIALASGCQNKVMNVSKGERDNASLDQLRTAIDASADIVDQLTVLVRQQMERQHGEEEIATEES